MTKLNFRGFISIKAEFVSPQAIFIINYTIKQRKIIFKPVMVQFLANLLLTNPHGSCEKKSHFLCRDFFSRLEIIIFILSRGCTCFYAEKYIHIL